MIIHPEVAEYEHEIKRVRRELHERPEAGYCEFKTQQYILDYMEKLFPDKLEKIAGTGVKAVFYAKDPAQTLAFRSDMDGLSKTEETGLPFASKNEGKMHACGHDGHMAVLLLFAKLVSIRRKELKTNIVLLFQPAEESLGGATRMIRDGALKNPDVERIFGLHIWPDVPFGKIGFREGPMMAQTSEFDIVLTGKSAHGANPDQGIDAIVAAAELIGMLQTVISRSLSPGTKALITIGKITGGEARNVIADRVEIKRYFADIQRRG